jgi:hypothetical protein
MRSRSEKRVRIQAGVVSSGVERVRQLLMPMGAGMAAAKADLMVQGVGLEASNELFQADGVAIVGEQGKHRKTGCTTGGAHGDGDSFRGASDPGGSTEGEEEVGRRGDAPERETVPGGRPCSGAGANQILLGVSPCLTTPPPLRPVAALSPV